MRFAMHAAVAAMMLSSWSVAFADLARVGPVNPVNAAGQGTGFPKWYQDQSGLVLDLCMPDAVDPGAQQLTACLLEINPPYAFPTNFPDEAFYFRAVSEPLDMGGGRRAVLVLALEAAFANGAPANGDQMVFTRVRVTAGVPHDGDYRVTFPYGTEPFPAVVSTGGNRDIVFTQDVGISPGDFRQALTSRVGPFLTRADGNGNPLPPVTLNGAQFLSDGVSLETVTGSPFNTNYFEICGPFDGPGTDRCVRTDRFTLTGRLHNMAADPIGSPLTVERATYFRDAAGVRVDVSASASAGIGQAAPRLSVGGVNLPPVSLAGPSALGRFYAQGLPLAGASVPGSVTLINSADVPPSAVEADLVDDITVTAASYDPGSRTLLVTATTSDKGDAGHAPPRLALEGFPQAMALPATSDPSTVDFTVENLAVPPASVAVTSSAGGNGSLGVTMGAGSTPFPAGVPLARNDFVTAIAGGPAVTFGVRANDIAPVAAPITGGPTLLDPAASPIGTVVINADGSGRFTPTGVTGSASYRYTVANAVGASNVATISVTVQPPAGGPVPIAAADSISVNAGSTRVIDVLANDSGNGGTLNPASVRIVTPPAAGTATVNAANGSITYSATTAPASISFTYTVANTNGNASNTATVSVAVIAPETVNVTRARCGSNRWDVRGTSTVAAGNTITLYTTGSAPLTPTAQQVLGSVPVDALGNWQFQLAGGAPCVSPISLRSTLGTRVNNIAVQLR